MSWDRRLIIENGDLCGTCPQFFQLKFLTTLNILKRKWGKQPWLTVIVRCYYSELPDYSDSRLKVRQSAPRLTAVMYNSRKTKTYSREQGCVESVFMPPATTLMDKLTFHKDWIIISYFFELSLSKLFADSLILYWERCLKSASCGSLLFWTSFENFQFLIACPRAFFSDNVFFHYTVTPEHIMHSHLYYTSVWLLRVQHYFHTVYGFLPFGMRASTQHILSKVSMIYYFNRHIGRCLGSSFCILTNLSGRT